MQQPQQRPQQPQQPQQPRHAVVGGGEGFNNGGSAASGDYAQQQNNSLGGGTQGYYYQADAGHNTQQQYGADAASYPPQTNGYQQQPYWYAPSYGGGESSNNAAQHGNPQEVIGLALRDRDVKTQRRKEANRESARRSKQRKKEESEILSTKAQELVRESTSLRFDLQRVQKHADRLFAENQALRSQVARFGGALSPSPARVAPVKMPPPIDFPLSLWKEVDDPCITVKKEPASSGGSDSDRDGESEQNDPVGSATEPAMMRPAADVLGEGDIDFPSMLNNAEAVDHADHFAQQASDMLLSESFRERDSAFAGRLDDDDSILGRALRNAQFPMEGLDEKATSRRSLDVSAAAEHFDLIRRSEIGQGG